MKHKIGIIICYFGVFPWYFPYFIHSCRFNPTIDFYIITDCEFDEKMIPRNVRMIKTTIGKIAEKASSRLGFEVSIECAYKFCDFKPAYGFLFPELIEGCSFWAHADLDVVYGDIRYFLTDEILDEFDIISSRHDYITGTLCFFKNSAAINTLFMQSRDYRHVLSTGEHHCFDECAFLWEELEGGASIFDFPDRIESMTYVVKKAQAEHQLKAFFDFMIVEGTPGNIMWKKGKIVYKNQFEALLYHLIKFKTECSKPIILNPIPNEFHFTQKNIRA